MCSLQAKQPQGEDKTIPKNIVDNLEEFSKEQIEVRWLLLL